jgi:hypothetical protein
LNSNRHGNSNLYSLYSTLLSADNEDIAPNVGCMYSYNNEKLSNNTAINMHSHHWLDFSALAIGLHVPSIYSTRDMAAIIWQAHDEFVSISGFFIAILHSRLCLVGNCYICLVLVLLYIFVP